jgi:hypothetical protein
MREAPVRLAEQQASTRCRVLMNNVSTKLLRIC